MGGEIEVVYVASHCKIHRDDCEKVARMYRQGIIFPMRFWETLRDLMLAGF